MKYLLLRVIFLLISLSIKIAANELTDSNNRLSEQWSKESSKGIGVFNELLCWKTNITTFPYVVTAVLGENNFPTEQNEIEARFGYHPGFRLGAAYAFCKDEWDVSLYYTRFNQSAFDSIERTASLRIFTAWDILGLVRADSASAELHQRFQTIDLVMGKTFSWDCPFSLRYYAGFKWAQLRTVMDVVYAGIVDNPPEITGAVINTITLANRSNNIGILNGVHVDWDLKWGIGIYSRAEIALMRSNFCIKLDELIDGPALNPPGALALNNKFNYKSIKSNLVSEIGLRWGADFCGDCVSVEFNVGYEFNYWPTQLLIKRFITPRGEFSAFILQQTSDIGFRGFNFGASLNF